LAPNIDELNYWFRQIVVCYFFRLLVRWWVVLIVMFEVVLHLGSLTYGNTLFRRLIKCESPTRAARGAHPQSFDLNSPSPPLFTFYIKRANPHPSRLTCRLAKSRVSIINIFGMSEFSARLHEDEAKRSVWLLCAEAGQVGVCVEVGGGELVWKMEWLAKTSMFESFEYAFVISYDCLLCFSFPCDTSLSLECLPSTR
jgi:hypothetical protein